MKKIIGSVTAPKGFLAAGINCGIKRNKLDLALIFSQVPALAAGVFTRNKVKAAPLKVCEKHLRDGQAQAIIVNSGNANCLSGRRGFRDALDMATSLASALSLRQQNVLPLSTGMIGKPLPVHKIKTAIPNLVNQLDKSGGLKAARAIMTTDLCPKRIAVATNIGGHTVRIDGIAKGSGMICPNMATMLCFVTTDARIELATLRKSLKDAVNNSFNAITVDGDMSTNDTVLVLANAQAGNPRIRYGTKNYKIFYNALSYVTTCLAKKIVSDGEGASKFIEIEVRGARSETDAIRIGKTVANSNLVKTALAGEDPNIGRIAAAAGAAGVKFNETKLNIYLSGIKMISGGKFHYQTRPEAKQQLRKKEIKITLDLNSGQSQAKIWTCDLTEGYIKINARYN